MDSSHQVFGLSIGEQIEWAVGDVKDGELSESFVNGVLPDIPNGNLPHVGEKIDIEKLIRDRLRDLKSTNPDYFNNVEAVGVSTAGIVDRQNKLLDSIARKNWEKKEANHIINFDELFRFGYGSNRPLFPKLKSSNQIVVHNDASARCLAEAKHGVKDGDKFFSLLYIMASEGVNGAALYGDDILKVERNSELGHCLPQLHPDDLDFLEKHAISSGCPSHITCFEGLVTTARIRQQWPDIHLFSHKHPVWRRIVFYLAQLVMIGVASYNPERVRFGGPLFVGRNGERLVADIQSEFIRLNGGYFPYYKSPSAIHIFIERATFGDGVAVLAALTVGCMAAFPENTPIGTVTDLMEEVAKRARQRDKS